MELMVSNELTMSSREIADLVESRHDKVRQSIERLANRGVIQLPPLGEVRNHLGQIVKNYIFAGEKGKRDSIIVVAQLSPEFTARLVDRWRYLETRQAPQIPQSFSEALMLAAKQAKQLELQAPKVRCYDKIVNSSNLQNATQVAQKLRLSAIKMNRHLDELRVYNRSVKRGRVFNHWFVEKGYGIMRQTELGYPQPMFTTRGEAWIVEQLTAEGVA